MDATIHDSIEAERGCGFRKGGGLYLVSSGPAMSCGRLPAPLDVCPTCHGGIKPSRGWTWVEPGPLLADRICTAHPSCPGCPLDKDTIRHIKRCGLLWVGERYYPSPESFLVEAQSMGISRRLSAVPKDFRCGETWVLFAHRKAILPFRQNGTEPTPGIIAFVRPTAIEYVVNGDESDDELEALAARGLRLVRVVHQEEEVKR